MTTTTPAATGSAPIPLRLIRRDRNIRTNLDLDDDFVASIEAQGILVRCVVEPLAGDPDGYEYVAVAGHRRMAALEQTHGPGAVVPCDVQLSDGDAERALFMLIENLQRHDLDPVDEARGYARVLEAGWTQRELAESVGRPAARVAQRIALLRLDGDELDKVRAGTVTLDDAVELAKIDERVVRDRVVAEHTPYQSLAQTAKEARRRLALEAKRDEQLAEFARLGVASGKGAPRKKPGGPEPRRIAPGTYTVDFDDPKAARAHRSEPCHYVQLDLQRWSEKVETVDWCTDPGRHTGNGASALKAATQPSTASNGNGRRPDAVGRETAAERAAREERDQAWAAFTKTITGGGPVTNDQRDAVMRAALSDAFNMGDVDDVWAALAIDRKNVPYGPKRDKAIFDAVAQLGGARLARLLATQLLCAYGDDEPRDLSFLRLAAAFGWELDAAQQKLVAAARVEDTNDVADIFPSRVVEPISQVVITGDGADT